MPYLFTSESVSEGHPDKVADQISDALVDNFLAWDNQSKIACETLVTTGQVVLAETVGSIAGACVLDSQRAGCVGMEINANHLRPVRDGWVYATARPEALGRSTHVWSIRIEDEAGKLVCISRLTLAVISTDRK